MEKEFTINNRWSVGFWWRHDFKFIGFIEYDGFGRYIGIKF